MSNIGVGGALGILLGMLIGLSASEVVAGVVTALVGLLGVLFGLRSENAAGVIPGGNGGRVVGFALAMAVSLPLAVMARTHGWLEPSPAERAAAWVVAGMEKPEAAALVAFERTGLVPAGRAVGTANRPRSGTGALFSGEGTAACDALLARRYGSAAALESVLAAEGGEWAALARDLPPELDETARLQRLQGRVEALCWQP